MQGATGEDFISATLGRTVPSLRPSTLALAAALVALLSILPSAASPTSGSYPVALVSTHGSLAWSDPSCGGGAFHHLTATAILQDGALARLEIHADPAPGLHDGELHLSLFGDSGSFVARGAQRYVVEEPTGSTEANLNCLAAGAVEMLSMDLACGALGFTLSVASAVASPPALRPVSQMTYTSSEGVACIGGYSYGLEAEPGGTQILEVACLHDAALSVDLDDDGTRDYHQPNLKTMSLGAC